MHLIGRNGVLARGSYYKNVSKHYFCAHLLSNWQCVFPPVGKLGEESDDPKVTWNRAREVMTRPDFINDLDHLNIIQIDTEYNVRPDSRLMQTVIKEVISEDDFQERLDSVRERVDAIEVCHTRTALHRTQ